MQAQQKTDYDEYVINEELTVYLTQDAFPSGTPGNEYYEAHAIDKDDNEYVMRWPVIDSQCEDASDACDWDDYTIRKL